MRASSSQLFAICRKNDKIIYITKYKTNNHCLHNLKVHSSPFPSLMFLLNIVVDETLYIKSSMLFYYRLPRNFIESMPDIMLFTTGICSKSLALRSYLMTFLIKHSCMRFGMVLLSILYISIIRMDICFAFFR